MHNHQNLIFDECENIEKEKQINKIIRTNIFRLLPDIFKMQKLTFD